MAGLTLPVLLLLRLRLFLLGVFLLHPRAGSRLRGVLAVLEVVVRHVEAVANAALDCFERRPVPVLAQVQARNSAPVISPSISQPRADMVASRKAAL